MISDEQLRGALRREATSHEPDLPHLRARFEAGRAAVVENKDMSAPQNGRDWSGRRRSLHAEGRPVRRFSPMLRPAVLVAAVVCAVTGLTHTAALTSLLNHDSGKNVTAGQVASGSNTATSAPTPSVVVPSATPKGKPSSSTHPPTKIGAPATTHGPVKTSECSLGEGILLAPYWLTDNLWAADRGTGTQCVKALSGPGRTVRWSTTWNWSGGEGQVKSFASVVLGWHWGWSVSNSGLPAQTSTLNSIPTTWNFSVEQTTPSQLDVAYDLWFHNIPKPTTENPSAEVRIVVNRVNLAPQGPDGWTGRYSIDGASWDLYKGGTGWGVYTFVRADSATQLKLDLKRYIDVARVVAGPDAFTYLSSVQAGADVQIGSGKLTTSSYSVKIR